MAKIKQGETGEVEMNGNEENGENKAEEAKEEKELMEAIKKLSVSKKLLFCSWLVFLYACLALFLVLSIAVAIIVVPLLIPVLIAYIMYDLMLKN